MAKRKAPPPEPTGPKQRGSDGLTSVQRAFALAYLANGWRPGPAYRATHPNAAPNTCYTEGWKLLRNPKVAAFVARKLEPVWKRAEMSAEEAAARIAWDARADAGALFDGAGRVRPITTLPPELRQSIKRVKTTRDGLEVQLNDSLAARRTILELHGKLKGGTEGLQDLAKMLAERWKPEDRAKGAVDPSEDDAADS